MSFPRYERYKDSGVEWLGKVPEHWEISLSKRYLTVQSGDMISYEDEKPEGYPLIGGNGLRAYTDRTNSPADTLVLGRVGAQCGCVHHLREAFWASEHAYRVIVRKSLDKRFFFYLLTALDLNQFAIKTAQPLLNTSIVETQWIAAPAVREQLAIGTFLDDETAKIDELIEEQRRLIELLKEKRQAVISHTVTNGLDADVTMRDSGLPGLGTVPSHWEVLRLKEVCQRDDGIQMGPFGGMLLGLDSEDTGFKVYGQQNTIWGDFSLGDRWISPKRYESLERYRLQVGDLVLTRKGSLGNARLVKTEIMPGIIDSDTIRIRLEALRARSLFVTLLFHEAFYVEWEIDMMKRGAILPGVNSRTIANLFIALPPRPEQDEIMEYLATRLVDLDQLIENVNASTLILLERRSALISAAVTGKIDVRNYTPKEAA